MLPKQASGKIRSNVFFAAGHQITAHALTLKRSEVSTVYIAVDGYFENVATI